jgi:thiamine pyrophosphokinase
MKYITDDILRKIKENKITFLTKLDKQLIKQQILYDLRDIKDYIKTTRITNYGLYIYFKKEYKLCLDYDFISYRCFKDIENDYKLGIKEILYILKVGK